MDSDGYGTLRTIFDQLVFEETLEASGAGETLRDQKTGGNCDLVAQACRPFGRVLQKCRKRSFLQRFLEILVSENESV